MPDFGAVFGVAKFGPHFPICEASTDLGDIWWREVDFSHVNLP